MEDQSLKRALLSLIIRTASEGSGLDNEDQEMLVKHRMGEITRSQLEAFINMKAKRIQQQIERPQ